MWIALTFKICTLVFQPIGFQPLPLKREESNVSSLFKGSPEVRGDGLEKSVQKKTN